MQAVASFAADVQVLLDLIGIAVILLCLSGVFVFNLGGGDGGTGGRSGLLSHVRCPLNRSGQRCQRPLSHNAFTAACPCPLFPPPAPSQRQEGEAASCPAQLL